MNDLFCYFQEGLPLIKDAILTLAAIVAGYVGLMGLGTWRRQLKGNAEYDLAKSVLKSVWINRDTHDLKLSP